jgi:hypothetical protein
LFLRPAVIVLHQEASMLTLAPATHDISELIAGKMMAAADNPVLSQHVEQAQLLECPQQNEAYFDVIMRVRRRRPVRRLHLSLIV